MSILIRACEYTHGRSISSINGVFFFFILKLIEGNCESQGIKDFMNESNKLMDLLNSSDYVPTYEDKDGDWMLVGDVPWE
jgi:hypothetical protein